MIILYTEKCENWGIKQPKNKMPSDRMLSLGE